MTSSTAERRRAVAAVSDAARDLHVVQLVNGVARQADVCTTLWPL